MKSNLLRVLGLILMTAASAWAQSNLHDWNNVKNIPFGSEIWLKSAHGRHLGTFELADDGAVRLREWRRTFFGGQLSHLAIVRKEDVREVRFARSGLSTLAGAAIGAAAGVGIGLGVEAQYPNKTEDGHLLSGTLGFLGGAFGGVVGKRTSFVHGAKIYIAK